MKKVNQDNINLNNDELERYSRHLSLPEIGLKGQKLLKKSSVICIGTGGLGSPVLMYLAAAGIGRIGIVDKDLVEKSNLQRQVIHSNSSIGKEKAESARTRILEINPNCNLEIFKTYLTKENALEVIDSFDLVCDCTDNFESRYLINDASVILGKPIVYGAISKFEGQASVFNLNKESPNFRDLMPQPPPRDLLPSCSEAGVIGVLPGLIGLIQATEVIKIITGIGESLSGRILVFNALEMKFKELKLKRDVNRQPIRELIDYQEFCTGFMNINETEIKETYFPNISAKDLKKLIESNSSSILLLDVRSSLEAQIKSIQASILIPLEDLDDKEKIQKLKEISVYKEIFVYCETGKRSLKALAILQNYGIKGTNLLGGMKSWELDK